MRGHRYEKGRKEKKRKLRRQSSVNNFPIEKTRQKKKIIDHRDRPGSRTGS